MVRNMILQIMPTLIMLGAMACVVYPSVWFARVKLRGRRSPLTSQLLRSPGETIAREIEELSADIYCYLMITVALPLGLYSTYLTQLYFAEGKFSAAHLLLYGVFGIVSIVLLLIKMTRKMNMRNSLRLGQDAERAVGQELNHLMSLGYRVYHDFPAENFNIDHVAIGPGGVFAIETKGRAKPDKGRGQFDAKVSFDGRTLRFPGWEDEKPLEQARRQALWLARWLGRAVGEPVAVKPVLALPGWFVDRKKPCDVVIYSGKSPQGWAKVHGQGQLSEKQIECIDYQVEQRCRDVEPAAYRKIKS